MSKIREIIDTYKYNLEMMKAAPNRKLAITLVIISSVVYIIYAIVNEVCMSRYFKKIFGSREDDIFEEE